MKNRIHILKGRYQKIRVSDCIFTLLKPLNINKGNVTAVIDASTLLGPEYTNITIEVEDYRLLD